MKIKPIIFSLLVIAACGGSGGGGGGGGGGEPNPGTTGGGTNGGGGGNPDKNNPGEGTAPSYKYPNIKTDPKFVGDQIDFDGKSFTLTSTSQRKLVFNTTGRNGTQYQFADNLSYGGTRFKPLAMGNADAVGVTVFIDQSGLAEKDKWMFSLDGNWTKNVPTAGSVQYMGLYESLNNEGKSNGRFPVLISMDYDNIQKSTGADLVDGKKVYIHFTNIDGNSLSGTIADKNGDRNSATFGLFGDAGQTLMGGYASPVGNGMLIGSSKK